MRPVLPRRVAYRVRQFSRAVIGVWWPLTTADLAQVRSILPSGAWPLYAAMPRDDQRHSLNVCRTLLAAGRREPALLEAALLHDCAKRAGGVRLWHRVLVVLLRALQPGWSARWRGLPAPRRGTWRYPLWAHANHPQHGAELAAAAGCDAATVALIRHHQDGGTAAADEAWVPLLAALKAADDEN